MTAPRVNAEPCRACPWLTANQGKRTPDGWYTRANLRRLWAGMRRGEHMSCHPTDSRNPLTDAQVAAGFRRAPEGAEMRQCVGAVIAQQREFMVLSEVHGADVAAYRKARPRGLTRAGIEAVLADFLFGGTAFGGGGAAAKPNLNLPVSAPDLDWPLGSGAPK